MNLSVGDEKHKSLNWGANQQKVGTLSSSSSYDSFSDEDVFAKTTDSKNKTKDSIGRGRDKIVSINRLVNVRRDKNYQEIKQEITRKKKEVVLGSIIEE